MITPFLILTIPVLVYTLLINYLNVRIKKKVPVILLSGFQIKKVKKESQLQKIVVPLETWMQKYSSGRKLFTWYQKTGLSDELTVGHIVIANILLIFAGYNLAGILKLDLILTYILMFAVEMAIFVYSTNKNASSKKIDKYLPALLSSISHTYESYPDLANALRESQDSDNNPATQRILKKTNDLIRIGYTPQEAMNKVSSEVGNPTLSFVIGSLALQQKTGADIAHFLSQTANQLTRQLLTKKEIEQILFQNKVSAIVSALIAPLMFLISAATSNNYREAIISSPVGRVVFLLATFWWIIGVSITYRSLRLK